MPDRNPFIFTRVIPDALCNLFTQKETEKYLIPVRTHQKGFLSTLALAFLVLCPPYLEYAVLRFLLHSKIELRIGWSLLVDYDLFLPIIGGFTLLFFCLMKEAASALKLSYRYLACNTISFVLVLLYGILIQNPGQFYSPLQLIPFWGLTFSTFFFAFCLMLPPSFYFLNKNRFALIPCLLITFSVVIQNHLFKPLFNFLGSTLSTSTCKLLKPFLGESLSCSYSNSTELAVLLHPDFAIKIGHGCGGGDGIVLFLCVFSLFYLFNKKIFSPLLWFLHMLSGVFFLYLVNLARISLLFLLGVYMTRTWGRLFSTRLIVSFFHIHLGWVLYTIAIAFFLKSISKSANYMSKYKDKLHTLIFNHKWTTQTSKLLVFLLLSTLFISTVHGEGSCGLACTFSSECTLSADCTVCDGVCVACSDLADSTSCGEVSTGASTNCTWNGSACSYSPTVPELPKTFLAFIVPLLLSLVIWKRGKPVLN